MKRIFENRQVIQFNWLMLNPNVTLDMIEYMLENDIEPDGVTGFTISLNPNLTMEFIKRKYPFLDWEWRHISSLIYTYYHSMSLADVIRNNHLPWHWGEIWRMGEYYPTMALEDIVQGRLKHDKNLDFRNTCRFEDLLFAYDGDIHETISRAPTNMSIPLHSLIEYGIDHLFRTDNGINQILGLWQFHYRMDRDPIEAILPHQQLHQFCTNNKTVTEEIIKTHPNIDWDARLLMKCHSDINMLKQIALTHPNYEPKYLGSFLSENPNLTLQFVIDNPHFPFDWCVLTENLRDLKFDVLQNMNNVDLYWKWNICTGSKNKWVLNVSEQEVQQYAKEIMAANTIKHAFQKSITHPAFELCRRRLQREFEDLSRG